MPWTPWITRNPEGHENSPLYTPNNARLVVLEVKEQAGYGVIDMRLHYQDPASASGTTWTAWACGNPNGISRFVAIPDGQIAVGMTVKEQAGYGVVDLKLHLRKNDGSASDVPFSAWACNNPNGVEKFREAPAGNVLTGLTVREQAGYGVADIRLYYVPSGRESFTDTKVTLTE